MLIEAVVLGAEQRVGRAFADRLAIEVEKMPFDEILRHGAFILASPEGMLAGGGIGHEGGEFAQDRSFLTRRPQD